MKNIKKDDVLALCCRERALMSLDRDYIIPRSNLRFFTPKFVEFTTKIVVNKIDGSILINSVLPDGTRYKIEVRM